MLFQCQEIQSLGEKIKCVDSDLNSCSHGVKIEVKQVDDNYTSIFIWINVVGFSSTCHDFQFEASVSNKTTRTQDIPYPRASYLIRLAA